MFKTLVVALDLAPDGDRALPVVQALARCGQVQVDLVTVSEPGMATAADAYELERRARAHGWDRDAWTVIHDVDAAGGLVQHTARRDEALLVMATSARRPITSSIFGSVPHDVLRRTDRPVLLIGPDVPGDLALPCTTLVPCLDPDEQPSRAVPTIVSWQRTFVSAPPQLIQVLPPAADDTGARARLDDLSAQLAAQHIHAGGTVVFDDDLVDGLEVASSRFAGPVYVTTSARYTDGRLHWHSATQRLVRHGTCPVLVIPARPALLPADPVEDIGVAFRDRTAPAWRPVTDPGVVSSA